MIEERRLRALLTAARLSAVAIGGALRIPNLAAPYRSGLDSGFQEALALAHVDLGLAVTKGLPTIGVLDGQTIHHTTHPPLLHWIYGAGYALFGQAEWVARSVNLLAFCASVWLIGSLAALTAEKDSLRSMRIALGASAFFALMPLSTRYGQSAAFGTLAVGLILGGLVLLQRAMEKPTAGRIAAACAVWIAALLTEWTAYLAFPLLFLHWVLIGRRDRSLGWPLLFIALPTATLAAYLGWSYANTGMIELASHASVRTDTGWLLRPAFWSKLLKELAVGAPIAIPLAIWGAISTMKSANFPAPIWALAAPFLYIAVAPQLIGQHPFELYNFVPLLALFAALGAFSMGRRWGWVLLALSLANGGRIAATENNEAGSFFYNLSQVLNNIGQEGETIYSAAAVGHFRFYTPLRVYYALGAGMPEMKTFLERHRPEWVWSDATNPDVQSAEREADRILAEGWKPLMRFAHGALHMRKDLPIAEDVLYDFITELPSAEWNGPADALAYEVPAAVLVENRMDPGNYWYALRHHPMRRGTRSSIAWKGIEIPEEGALLDFGFGMDPSVFRYVEGDGVELGVYIDGTLLIGTKLDPKKNPGQRPWGMFRTDLSVVAGQTVEFRLETDSMKDASYDLFYWLRPVIRVGAFDERDRPTLLLKEETR